MQEIIVTKPYKFIPPHRGNWVPSLIQRFRVLDRYLNRFGGIVSHEVRGAQRLRESLNDGCGILLAPNHCRYADPLAMGWVAREVDVHVYAMASWHLFHQSRFQAFAIRMLGGFSVYREGLDRQSLDTAVEILSESLRPLVVFPEGSVFRTNDVLQPLLDGVAFLARTAARRRAKRDSGKVVIHPVAIKYLFQGELFSSVEPVISSIESRLTWNGPSHGLRHPDDLLRRVVRIARGLLALKEIRTFGHVQTGSIDQRQERLIDHLLSPLEQAWIGRKQQGKLLQRIKLLRTTIVPHLTKPETSAAKKDKIWSDLADIYLAQQVGSYPTSYFESPTDTRILETVERFEEDLTDRCRIYRPLHAILEVGEAIEVEPAKPPRDQEDPIMQTLSTALQNMLDLLSAEARPIDANCR